MFNRCGNKSKRKFVSTVFCLNVVNGLMGNG